MLLVTIVAMALIVSAWSIWFFPRANTPGAGETAFESFTRDVLKSFSVLAPERPAADDAGDKINIDDLRARVFGDSARRP